MISTAGDKLTLYALMSSVLSSSRRVCANLFQSELFRFGLFFLFIAVLLILRRPDAITNPQLVAEDGSLIFSDQFLKGGLRPILDPYGGYFIVNTRLIGFFSSFFPVLYAPLIYNLAAVFIAAFACSLFSWSWYCDLVASNLVRRAACVLAACALFTDILIDELANTQWYLGLIGLLLLARPACYDKQRSSLRLLLLILLAGLATLTGPVLIVAAPIALWQVIFRKGRAKTVPAAMLVGCLLQVFCFFHSSYSSTVDAHVSVHDLLKALFVSITYKVLIYSLAGERTAIFVANNYTGIVWPSTILGTALLVWLWLRLNAQKRLQMAIALYLGLGFVLIALAGRGLWSNFLTAQNAVDGPNRYFVLSKCILVLLFAMILETILKRSPTGFKAAFLLLLFSGGVIASYRVPSFPDRRWAERAREIMNWQSDRREGRAVAGLSIPLHPEGWFIRLLPTFRRASVVSH